MMQEYWAAMLETRVSQNWAPCPTSSLLVVAEGLKGGFLCRDADCNGGFEVLTPLLCPHIPVSYHLLSQQP